MTPDQILELRLIPLSRSSLYDALRRGDIKSVRVGRRLIIPRAAIAELCGEEER
jgi:hypothetical protein